MLYRLGKLTVRYRWPIVLFWLALLIVSAPFALRVSSHLKAGFGAAKTESQAAIDLGRQEFGTTGATVTLVFQDASLRADDPAYQARVQETMSPLREVPEVVRIETAKTTSPDGRTSYATVYLNSEVDTSMRLSDRLTALLRPPEGMRAWATGGIPIFADINRLSEQDLRRAETISLPLVLLALLLVFGGLVAAGLPTIVGAVSVVISLAAMSGLARATDVSIFALNIVSFLGLGLAIDYSLLIVSRFREELEAHDKEEAIARALSTSGRAILFSGATSFLGLAGLLLFKFMLLRSIGIGGMLVVSMSMLLAMTLLPAVLSLVGGKINALSVLPRRKARGESAWRRIALWVMKYPLAVAVPLVVLLVVLGAPFLRVRLGEPWEAMLPPGTQSREGWSVAARELGPGELSPVFVLAKAQNGPLDPASVGALYDLTRAVAADPRVQRVESIVNLDPSLNKAQYQYLYSNPAMWPPALQEGLKSSTSARVTTVRIFSKYGPTAPETEGLIKWLRGMEPGGGLELVVGGSPANVMDSIEGMYRDFPWAAAFVIGTIYVALLVLFRSVVLPLKAVLMNALSIFASYGALVFIFQEGHFQRLLGFHPSGFTEPTIPILMFCILFGLSMDYEVFLLSRVKEAHDAGKDNEQSVAEGLERTGGIITSAALILVLVSASFATAGVVLIKALGIGIAIAILLDATLVRALLVPALMRVLGEWNWWAPRFIRARHAPPRETAGRR